MKSINNKIALTIILIFILGTSAYADETIRLATGEWAPYQSEKLVKGGFITDMITDIFAAEGINVELGYFPWNRSIELAKKGNWDGTFIWFDTAERRTDFYISDPVVDIKYVFFQRKDFQFNWNSVEDLTDVMIGATLGYEFGGEDFKNAEESGKIKVNRVYSDLQGMKNLLQGRIQIFPCDMLVGYELIENNFTPEQRQLITHHKKPVKAAPHHLLLSNKVKQNQRLIKIFNKGLKKLKATGEYEKYFERFRQGKYKK